MLLVYSIKLVYLGTQCPLYDKKKKKKKREKNIK